METGELVSITAHLVVRKFSSGRTVSFPLWLWGKYCVFLDQGTMSCLETQTHEKTSGTQPENWPLHLIHKGNFLNGFQILNERLSKSERQLLGRKYIVTYLRFTLNLWWCNSSAVTEPSFDGCLTIMWLYLMSNIFCVFPLRLTRFHSVHVTVANVTSDLIPYFVNASL